MPGVSPDLRATAALAAGAAGAADAGERISAGGGDHTHRHLTRPVRLLRAFSTRAAAEKFVNDGLDFFQIRRCSEDLHPDPAFPGCMYSEMKMCLAPCFRGCTDAEYSAEVDRVQAFLDTRGQSLLRALAERREQASAALEFENAAALHGRREKLTSVLAPLPEIVRRIDRLDGLLLQPSSLPDCVALFRIQAGRCQGPILFNLQQFGIGSMSATVASREGSPATAAARLRWSLA